ncbi:hypothetical protein U6Y41_12675 [Cutibacterium acnes]
MISKTILFGLLSCSFTLAAAPIAIHEINGLNNAVINQIVTATKKRLVRRFFINLNITQYDYKIWFSFQTCSFAMRFLRLSHGSSQSQALSMPTEPKPPQLLAIDFFCTIMPTAIAATIKSNKPNVRRKSDIA